MFAHKNKFSFYLLAALMFASYFGFKHILAQGTFMNKNWLLPILLGCLVPLLLMKPKFAFSIISNIILFQAFYIYHLSNSVISGEYVEIPLKEISLKFDSKAGELIVTDSRKKEEYEYNYKNEGDILYAFEITGDTMVKRKFHIIGDTLFLEPNEKYLKSY